MFIKDDRIYGASSSSSTTLILCPHSKSPVLNEKKDVGTYIWGKRKEDVKEGASGRLFCDCVWCLNSVI